MNQHNAMIGPNPYDMTSAPHLLVNDIVTAAHNAYVAVENSPGGKSSGLTYADVKRSPSCLTVASRMTSELVAKDYEAQDLGCSFMPNKIAHLATAIACPEVEGGFIVADATWQQFMPHRSRLQKWKDRIRHERPPAVLIGTPQEIGSIALGFGFSDEQAATWSELQYPLSSQ